ncbi:hypothetical protein IEQ34_005734 [Dendrobium chrysotoxum]|uniref:Uncharacterized protein n=1 Tax=Dendrobium chrysotoxum TaxID=161865 RepID=A0AAV7H8Y0_DENCH|nr:hypothetical protein IEQ34_005734 [Dendrobium chrysotoxum]
MVHDGLVEEVWQGVVKKMKKVDIGLVENHTELRWAIVGDDQELLGRQLENMLPEDLLDELLIELTTYIEAQVNLYWIFLAHVIYVFQDIERYKLANSRAFHYLNQTYCDDLEGVDELKEYLQTRRAMEVVGISTEEQLIEKLQFKWSTVKEQPYPAIEWVGKVTEGLDRAVLTMENGEFALVAIPPELQNMPSIPPNQSRMLL